LSIRFASPNCAGGEPLHQHCGQVDGHLGFILALRSVVWTAGVPCDVPLPQQLDQPGEWLDIAVVRALDR
jgi:hypothetical protein